MMSINVLILFHLTLKDDTFFFMYNFESDSFVVYLNAGQQK